MSESLRHLEEKVTLQKHQKNSTQRWHLPLRRQRKSRSQCWLMPWSAPMLIGNLRYMSANCTVERGQGGEGGEGSDVGEHISLVFSLNIIFGSIFMPVCRPPRKERSWKECTLSCIGFGPSCVVAVHIPGGGGTLDFKWRGWSSQKSRPKKIPRASSKTPKTPRTKN